jgi:hypothetical protein
MSAHKMLGWEDQEKLLTGVSNEQVKAIKKKKQCLLTSDFIRDDPFISSFKYTIRM